MLNLLKTDLKRILKDKLVLIGFIIVCGLSLMTILLYLVIQKLYVLNGNEQEIAGLIYNSKSLFLSSFSSSSNAGMMIPIFVSVVIIKDFRYGTIRNKIISGKSRLAIYLSSYISGLILGLVLYMISVFINLSIGTFLLGYGTDFNTDELSFILVNCGYGILNYMVFLSCAIFIAIITKNIGLSITFNIVGVLFLSILTIFTSVDFISDVVKNIAMINPMYGNNVIVNGLLWRGSLKDNLMTLIPSICYSVLFTLLGVIIFNKQDLK